VDKPVTVAVPEERVPEFYAWFARFLASEPGAPFGGPGLRGRRGRRGWGWEGERRPWTAGDGEEAAWFYGRLSDPARALFDMLIDAPGERIAGNEVARRLGLDKGAHGVAGVLAWPGRWSAKLGRDFPIETVARDDGGTDYTMSPETAAVFAAARERVRGTGGGEGAAAGARSEPGASSGSP
jgi:Family of unknown function (DUF6416)